MGYGCGFHRGKRDGVRREGNEQKGRGSRYDHGRRRVIAVGIVPVSALIAGTVETDEAGYIKAGEDGVTSVPGVFAAGDVRTKQLRQIITAAADGANCVTSVEKYLISH